MYRNIIWMLSGWETALAGCWRLALLCWRESADTVIFILKVKVDFFHSLPISRKKYFFVQYVSGVIIFVVPFIVSMLLCLLVGAVNGLLTGGVVLMAVRMTSFRILEYLAGYGTAILGNSSIYSVYSSGTACVGGMKSVFLRPIYLTRQQRKSLCCFRLRFRAII